LKWTFAAEATVAVIPTMSNTVRPISVRRICKPPQQSWWRGAVTCERLTSAPRDNGQKLHSPG
jgi:hypothetical protein